MSLLDNLLHTVRHERNTHSRDALGADVQAREVITASVEAWIQNASRAEVVEFGKRDKLVSHRVYFSSNPAPRVGDYFVVTAGPSHVGEDLKFQADSDRSAGLGVLYGALCELENNERFSTFA